MTEKEDKAIKAMIEAGPDTHPWDGPVQHMGRKLGFPNTAEARTFAEDLLNKNLIRTVNVSGANAMMETGHVVMMQFIWERVPEDDT